MKTRTQSRENPRAHHGFRGMARARRNEDAPPRPFRAGQIGCKREERSFRRLQRRQELSRERLCRPLFLCWLSMFYHWIMAFGATGVPMAASVA
jgi:hypothetical protein